MTEVRNIIISATIKSDRCCAVYKERFVEANCTNKVTKDCDQIIHDDLRQAFLLLRPFLATITEQPESSIINSSNIDEPDEELEKELTRYFVTGYTRKGSEESASVMLTGQKILKSGQVLDLSTPYIKFTDDDKDAYKYGSELCQAIQRCDWEVSEYIFNQKYGFKQQQLDFETDTPQEADIKQEKPKKAIRGRKKKEKEAVPFDQFA